MAYGGGILALQAAEQFLVALRQGGFFGQIELVVEDDAMGAHGKQAGRRVPPDPPVHEDRQVQVFEIPLKNDKGRIGGHPARRLHAFDDQPVGGDTFNFLVEFDVDDFNDEFVVAVVELKAFEFISRAVGEDDELQVADRVAVEIIDQGLVGCGQPQAEEQVHAGQAVEGLNDFGIGQELAVQDRQDAGTIQRLHIGGVAYFGGVVSHRRQA